MLSVLEMYYFFTQHRPGRLHCNNVLSKRHSSYPKRKDCRDCHLEDCVDSGDRAYSLPIQLDRNALSFPAGIVSVRSIERFNSVESGSRNSIGDNSLSCDSEILPTCNWSGAWSVDLLKTWHHQEPAIGQFISLNESNTVKPSKSVVSDASPDLKTFLCLW